MLLLLIRVDGTCAKLLVLKWDLGAFSPVCRHEKALLWGDMRGDGSPHSPSISLFESVGVFVVGKKLKSTATPLAALHMQGNCRLSLDERLPASSVTCLRPIDVL